MAAQLSGTACKSTSSALSSSLSFAIMHTWEINHIHLGTFFTVVSQWLLQITPLSIATPAWCLAFWGLASNPSIAFNLIPYDIHEDCKDEDFCSNAFHALETSGQERQKHSRPWGRFVMGNSCFQEEGLLQSWSSSQARTEPICLHPRMIKSFWQLWSFQQMKQLLHQDGDLFPVPGSAFSTYQTTKTALEILPTLICWEMSLMEKNKLTISIQTDTASYSCSTSFLVTSSRCSKRHWKFLEMVNTRDGIPHAGFQLCSREKGMNNVYFNTIRSLSFPYIVQI